MLALFLIITLIALGVSTVALGISVNCTLCFKILSVVMMVLCLISIVSLVLIILQGDIICL